MGSALNSGKFTIGSAKGVYDKEVYIDDNGYYVVAAAEPTEGIEAAVAKTPGTNDYLAYSKVATEGKLKYTDVYAAIKNNASAEITVYPDNFGNVLDLANYSNFKGAIIVAEGQDLTIVNAPAGMKVEGMQAAIGSTYYKTLADALAYAQEAGMTEVEIVLCGETTKATTDSFDLMYATAFDKVTFTQEDASKVYYIYDLYTGSRTNGGEFVFDGVNIVVTDQFMFLLRTSTIRSALFK